MDRKTLIGILETSGISVAYGRYEQGTRPRYPYAVLNFLYSNEMRADDTCWVSRDRWQVDLVSKKRDERSEYELEKALRNAGLPFTKTQADGNDGCICIYYRFTTIGE